MPGASGIIAPSVLDFAFECITDLSRGDHVRHRAADAAAGEGDRQAVAVRRDHESARWIFPDAVDIARGQVPRESGVEVEGLGLVELRRDPQQTPGRISVTSTRSVRRRSLAERRARGWD